jgi:hypothetical protein
MHHRSESTLPIPSFEESIMELRDMKMISKTCFNAA